MRNADGAKAAINMPQAETLLALLRKSPPQTIPSSTRTTMPPRLSLARSCLACSSIPSSAPISTPLVPLLSLLTASRSQTVRHASILSRLSDNAGAYNKRIRRGRGPSSGKGKTSGRGHKGQKQHGKVPAGFNGGQTPLEVVHGKRGFENQFSLEMSVLNVDKIQQWIDQGRLDPSQPITVKELCRSRCLHGVKDGVKLLARVSGLDWKEIATGQD
jgi:large subunit ribosomal protein L15